MDDWRENTQEEAPAFARSTAGGAVSTDPLGSLGQRFIALAFGFTVSALLSAALVIATAKAGISPGVSPLVVLFGWVVFGRVLGPRLKGFLALAQVSGSGGAAVSAGAVFTVPIIQIYYRKFSTVLPPFDPSAIHGSSIGLGPAGWTSTLAFDAVGRTSAVLDASIASRVPEVDTVMMIVACVAGSLLGWGFVGFGTRRFLSDPRLPAPEAVACDKLIDTAARNPESRPPIWTSLIPGLLGGFLAKAAIQFKWMSETVCQMVFRLDGFEKELPRLTLPLPVSPIYLGIGALLTLPTAGLIFAGALVNSVTVGVTQQHALSPETFRWVGGAAMTVAVLYSLVHYAVEARRSRRAARAPLGAEPAASDDPLLAIPKRTALFLVLGVVAGAGVFAASLSRGGMEANVWIGLAIVAVILMALLSGLGGLLSLQVGSSASPVSGTVFMAMLVLSLTGLGLGLSGSRGLEFLVPILVATCVAICAANDSSQDYKTMQFNGFMVHRSFVGQLVGLLAGCVAVPVALSIAHQSGGFGSTDLPCPQAGFFATVLGTLFGAQQVPWQPCLVGAGLGVIAVGVEIFGRRRGMILSSLAFAVGIYLPAAIGIGILVGAVARRIGAGAQSRVSPTGVLTAAGLITGYALLALAFGLLTTADVDLAPWMRAEPTATSGFLGLGVLVALMALITWNYRRTTAAEREMQS